MIHNYRGRLGLAASDADLDDLEARLAQLPPITVPTISLEGDTNGAPYPDPSTYAHKFIGGYSHRTIGAGVGHNLPQECPLAFVAAVGDAIRSNTTPVGQTSPRVEQRM